MEACSRGTGRIFDRLKIRYQGLRTKIHVRLAVQKIERQNRGQSFSLYGGGNFDWCSVTTTHNPPNF